MTDFEFACVNDNDGKKTNKTTKYNNNDEGGTLLSMLSRNFSFLFFSFAGTLGSDQELIV